MVLATATPLFGQSKPILEKPVDKGLLSLDPALPKPTKPRLHVPLQQQLMNSSSLCSGSGWLISSCREPAKGSKNKTKPKNPTPSPLFWVREAASSEFRDIQMDHCQIPQPCCSSPSRAVPKAAASLATVQLQRGSFLPYKEPKECEPRVRRQEMGIAALELSWK